MPASRPRLRRFATQLLLVWLFAFGVGLAHACEMKAALQQGAGAVAEASVDTDAEANTDTDTDTDPDAPAAVVEAAHACCPTEATPAPADSACAKFCADEGSSLPSAKQAFDPAPMLDVAPLPTLGLAVRTVEERVAHCAAAAAAPPQRVPLPIALLRLAL